MKETTSLIFKGIKSNATDALNTAIREKKIDPLMIAFCQFVAKTNHYFTTSTCSGRITLMDLNENETKKENVFYRKWHRKVKKNEVWKAIEEYSGKGNLWLRQDPFVYVIGTDSLEHAKIIFRACQEAGVKRYGIHHFEPEKIIIEIFGTQHMGVPVKIKGKEIVGKESIQEYVKMANRKWTLNEEKRKKLEKEWRKRLVE